MITISVSDMGSSAAFSVQFNRVFDAVRNKGGLMRVVGRRGANELKAHFRRRDQTPNSLGGERTHWWRRVADSVHNPVMVGDNSIKISITAIGFALKVFGGTVVPKNRRALTIPVAPEAHGRTVAVFQQETGIQLFLLRKKGGGMSNLLAGIIGEHEVKVFYVLRKSVRQDKDPQALPNEAAFERALIDEAEQFLDREVNKI